MTRGFKPHVKNSERSNNHCYNCHDVLWEMI